MNNSDKTKVMVYKKHSLVIRWTHWVNFPLIMLMIVSGFMIYWANDAYTPFLTEKFYKQIGLDHKLALGLSIHFFFMWFFAINGLIYTLYLLFSGEWRELAPRLKSFRDAWLVALHDIGLRKNLPPQGKFNGGQRIAYSTMAILGFFQILTGLAIYKPVQLQPLLSLLGGYESARLLHFIVTIVFSLFFLIHILQVVRAGWNNFRSMITGTEQVHEAQDEKQ